MTPDNEMPKITYLPKLPRTDEIRLSENALVAVPTGTEGEFNIFSWRVGGWVYEYCIRRSDSALTLLNSGFAQLDKALTRLKQASVVMENEEQLLKLDEVTKSVARAQIDLAFDIIIPLKKSRDGKKTAGAQEEA